MTTRSIWELESLRLGALERDATHYRPYAEGAPACSAMPTVGASLTTSASIQMVTCQRCLTLTAAGA